MFPVNLRNPLSPGVRKVVLAEAQPEYDPVPALVFEREGIVLTEWALTPEEIATLQAGGRLRMYTYTFGQPFQPTALLAVGPDEMLPLETVS